MIPCIDLNVSATLYSIIDSTTATYHSVTIFVCTQINISVAFLRMSRRLEHHLNHIGNERVDYYCGTRFKDACLIRIHIFIIDSLVCPYTENPMYFL